MDIWTRAIPVMYEREDHVLVLLDKDRSLALGHAREFDDSDKVQDEDEDRGSNNDMRDSQDRIEEWEEEMGEHVEDVEFITTHQETESVRQQCILAEASLVPNRV